MPNLLLRGAYPRFFDFRNAGEGQHFTRIHMTADYSAPVREALDLPDFPDGVDSMKLDAELMATGMLLEPADAKLRGTAIQIDVGQVDHFEAVRVTEDGTSTTELRFTVRSAARGAVALLEGYMVIVGKAPALCTLAYSQQASLAEGQPDDGAQMPLVADEEGTPILRGDAAAQIITIERLERLDATADTLNRPLISHQAGEKKRRGRPPAEGQMARVGRLPAGASDEEAIQ